MALGNRGPLVLASMPNQIVERDLAADPYYKKIVEFAVSKRRIQLAVGETLFSTAEVDAGSRLLLRSLIEPGHAYTKVLDVGCGYGPLGLMLAASSGDVAVHMVDRDALAVRYAQVNTSLNGLAATASGSLAYDDVSDRDFDLIVANIPGKAGLEALRSFVLDARFHLAPDGTAAIVVVQPLAGEVTSIVEQTPGLSVVHHAASSRYAVFHYVFDNDPREANPGPGFDRGVYTRHSGRFRWRRLRYEATTVFGVPEFDSLSFQTELLGGAFSTARPAADRAVVYNPGQGHVAILLQLILQPSSLCIVDRDLLALRSSASNLQRNGFQADAVVHSVSPDPSLSIPPDLYVDVLRAKEPRRAATERVLEASRAATRTIILGGPSTAITRTIEDLRQTGAGLRVQERWRSRGFSAVLLKRQNATARTGGAQAGV